MLTRLKIDGFKNLVGVDIRFGPFTCVAGANGVGKSNLFDAIVFLSALADKSLVDAAMSVRGEGGRASDIHSIFHRIGEQYADEMTFEAEMIVPSEGLDDLGQKAVASITFLRYSVTLSYRPDAEAGLPGAIQLKREELKQINLGDAANALLFKHVYKWRKSAIKGRRTSHFISTETNESGSKIKLHQDGRSGRTLSRLAVSLPRTVLSSANAAENPTALLARREMQSWRVLQLEPSALRRPDELQAPNRLGNDGSHLPATLYHLAHLQSNGSNGGGRTSSVSPKSEEITYGQVANRLAELIDDVQGVRVELNKALELLTLYVQDSEGTSHPARALSDGTLRFLALAVVENDSRSQGLLCLEEPENGIHPERIPAMLRLLRDISVDVTEPVGPDNPLRQVIVNTHSPAVVGQVPDDSLVVAEAVEAVEAGQHYKHTVFSCLRDTWRSKAPEQPRQVPRGKLLAYLNPIVYGTPDDSVRRVIDHPEIQPLLPYTWEPVE
jgi:predicted ATPase